MVKTYVNKTKNIITFKIKAGYYLQLLTAETMKLLKNTKNKITTKKHDEYLPHLEITEVVLVHCNVVNNNCQQDSRALNTFVPNKPFDSFLEISPKNCVFLKTLINSEFQAIEAWFTDQNSKPLEIEEKTNVTLVIK